MNRNLKNGKTINSYLSSKKAEDRQQQIAELDLFVQERKKKKKNVLRFIKYWGASDKQCTDKYDLKALLMVFGLLRVIEKQYEMDAHITLIFTDTHATLNGYSADCCKRYFKDIGNVLNEFNYSHILMSEVLRPFIKSEKLKSMRDVLNLIIDKNLKYDIPSFLNGRISFDRLRISASKYSSRFYNSKEFDDLKFDSIDQAAYIYIKLNQIEKEYVEKKYANHIFLTYTSDEEKEFIAPELTTLQIFSYGKNMRGRPWFSKLNCLEVK